MGGQYIDIARGARRERKAIVAVALVGAMMVVNLLVIGMIVSQAREHQLTVRRVETVASFYAAEAGMNMSMREMFENADEDGDGWVGGISEDSNPGNDPTLGNAQFFVTTSESSPQGPQTTITSEGRSGQAKRTMVSSVN